MGIKYPYLCDGALDKMGHGEIHGCAFTCFARAGCQGCDRGSSLSCFFSCNGSWQLSLAPPNSIASTLDASDIDWARGMCQSLCPHHYYLLVRRDTVPSTVRYMACDRQHGHDGRWDVCCEKVPEDWVLGRSFLWVPTLTCQRNAGRPASTRHNLEAANRGRMARRDGQEF